MISWGKKTTLHPAALFPWTKQWGIPVFDFEFRKSIGVDLTALQLHLFASASALVLVESSATIRLISDLFAHIKDDRDLSLTTHRGVD